MGCPGLRLLKAFLSYLSLKEVFLSEERVVTLWECLLSADIIVNNFNSDYHIYQESHQ